jgi:lipoate-protein ligase A
MKTSQLTAKSLPLYLLQLNCSIYDQLQLEEALLRSDDRNWCIINRSTSPAIVMGISSKKELFVDSKKISQAPVPLIRRFSGGGTVFIDENTYMISWICNSACSSVECSPTHVHEWIKFFYQSALSTLDIQLRENDYVIKDRKFGGNAQYFRKHRWLHHSSLLWDYNPQNMDYLLMPPKMPQYRQKRMHDHFLCRLKDFLPSQIDFEMSIFNTLHRLFLIKIIQPKDVDHLLTLDHRKATQLITIH